MSESQRPEPLDPPDDTSVQHDAKTEDLLLAGFDRYFAGEYQQAINVWTRVLFLDRGHARARAYIERARSALAEQQRESEELLDNGVAAFNRGEIDLARKLLTSALDSGGTQDLALPILARLNRLESAVSAVESAQRPAAFRAASPAAAETPKRSGVFVWLVVLIAVVAGAMFVVLNPNVEFWMLPRDRRSEVAPVVQSPVEPLPQARPGEMALERATSLFEAGAPRDALRELARVRPTDPRRPEADRLRADIQRALLAPLQTPLDAVAPEARAEPAGTAAE